MKLLASICPEDVDPASPHFDYSTFAQRTAGRVVLFDGERVALIHVSKHSYYMLPGGGVDKDEDMFVALRREVMEEIACEAKIEHEVGSVELYFDRWQQKQVDYCYIARKIGEPTKTAHTDFEKQEGHKTVWASSLAEAIRLVEDSMPEERDGKLVRARDLLFLKTVAARQ